MNDEVQIPFLENCKVTRATIAWGTPLLRLMVFLRREEKNVTFLQHISDLRAADRPYG